MDVIGDGAEAKPADGDILNESLCSISDLQLKLGEFREKYLLAIEKLMRRRSKLEIAQLNQQCENMTVMCDRTLTIPDFIVPTIVESRCTEADITNSDELKKRIKRQMDVMETLNKMKNCPVAQAMLKL